MAHPHNGIRQHKVEHSRVARITKGYASGGAVHDSPSKPGELKKVYKERDSQAVEGGSVKERLDRPGRALRAKGGRVGKHKGTNVNVIVAPQGGGHPGLAPPAVPAGAPMASPPMVPPPRPPMMPPPGGPPMVGGAPPPGMPPRHAGGRAFAKGGAVKDGPAWNEGLKAGTPVQNNPSGKNSMREVNRGKPVTYRTGGAVKLPGGSGGGEARLAKERMAKRSHNGMAP